MTRRPILCTYKGCEHRHTFTEGEETTNLGWVDPATGHATCGCHYPRNTRPTFPCDEARTA